MKFHFFLFALVLTGNLLVAAEMPLTLMHEMRATPMPLNGAVVELNPPVLMWPEQQNVKRSVLDGVEEKVEFSEIIYEVRLASDSLFSQNVQEYAIPWAFYYPGQTLAVGTWYWQYGTVDNENIQWSDILNFTIKDKTKTFCPPTIDEALKKLPSTHPRILVTQADWDDFRMRNKNSEGYLLYKKKAEKALRTPILSITQVDMETVNSFDNEVQRKAYLTRESRKVIDKEEQNVEALVRMYVLTKDEKYADSAMERILRIVEWGESEYVAGDFNRSVVVSLATIAYDSFYDILSADEKDFLRQLLQTKTGEFYAHFLHHLEAHIADNHVWQMTYRIFTMAAFAVYGEIPEADTWVRYAYNLWLARFPGLNNDGAWHNGDSYFEVNIRTLIEVPFFYSRLTGYDFFQYPWYQGSAMFAMFTQPPFSKSAGNGSSHINKVTPSGVRVGYLDALARLTGNTYAADYVQRVQAEKPDILSSAFLSKPGDLTWFRMQCNKPLPQGKGLSSLPLAYVFPNSGLAIYQSDWNDYKKNAMLSFRSSPYGSTSHALANQNSFNTFYGGQSLFYSSGHHTSFVDRYAINCHRGTRAHNTILVNGMGQRIGTEGYGWMPRSYVGRKVAYVMGDASNAYGEVVSELWKERGRLSDVPFTPAFGWDKNHLKTYRRHIVELGDAGLVFIYDELEADTPVRFNYLLHTVLKPMETEKLKNGVFVRASNDFGMSDAYLYSSQPVETQMTDTFFLPAVNWLKGKGKMLPNHWHFTATTPETQIFRFATVICTHAAAAQGIEPIIRSNGDIHVGEWVIRAELSEKSEASFTITNKREKVSVNYKGKTRIVEGNTETVLSDILPELEI